MSFTFEFNLDGKPSMDDAWKEFGVMGAILESTKNKDRIYKHGGELLQEIKKGATKEDIQKRIVNLLLEKKIGANELFIFHEVSWQFQSDFDRAYIAFRRSLMFGRLALENNL